jgi:serine/threonine protein kinase
MSPTDPPPAVPRYEIHGLLARGGAGEVYRARDTAIGHDVAIKILFPGAAPNICWRFLTTARIMVSLHHPGLPPVHEVNQLPDGRPYLVMKLIKGRTLAQILKEPESSSRLPALVEVFERVCQTIGYAHAQAVIHRDINPSSVMIGAFGEVQVISWGQAKERDQRKPARVVGTPLYIPPEQAREQPADERSDVFGLGGILCHILTGGPPFRGENADDVLRMAAAGDLTAAFSRLDSSGADPELIDLCKRCLSPEPANRPPDAGEVARFVSTYRITAEDRQRDAAVAAGRATERLKRRVTQLALALAIVLWLVTLGIWWSALASK